MNNIDSPSAQISDLNQKLFPQDDTCRLEKRGFLWKRFSIFRTLSDADKKIQLEVIDYFQRKYGIDDPLVFKNIWKKLGATIWNPSKLFTEKTVSEIDHSFRSRLIFHGKGIEGPAIEGDSLSMRVQKFVHTLVHGLPFPNELIEKRAAKAIFVKHDTELMNYFKEALQEELTYLGAHPPINEEETFVWNAFLGNILALLPYAYPSEGEHFSIPRIEGSECKIDRYVTKVIKLDYPGVSSPMNALGLAPIDSSDAPNLLVFMGTTFPAGQGFAATILSDFTPGHSVGELIYGRNKHKIEEWLKGKENITAVGLSLGGALVFHAIRNHPHVFSKAEIFSPPGLYPSDWSNPVSEDCKVNIYTQKGDLVTKLGAFPVGENISLYSIIPHHDGVKETPLHAHLRVFSGCKKVTILKKDIAEENQDLRRRLLTVLHKFIAPFAVFLPFSVGFIGFTLLKKIKHITKSIFKKPSVH